MASSNASFAMRAALSATALPATIGTITGVNGIAVHPVTGLVYGIAKVSGTAGRVLGVHMAGPWVTEQLGQAYLAVNWQATVDEIAHFIQPHPSLSENFGEAVLALTGRSLNG